MDDFRSREDRHEDGTLISHVFPPTPNASRASKNPSMSTSHDGRRHLKTSPSLTPQRPISSRCSGTPPAARSSVICLTEQHGTSLPSSFARTVTICSTNRNRPSVATEGNYSMKSAAISEVSSNAHSSPTTSKMSFFNRSVVRTSEIHD